MDEHGGGGSPRPAAAEAPHEQPPQASLFSLPGSAEEQAAGGSPLQAAHPPVPPPLPSLLPGSVACWPCLGPPSPTHPCSTASSSRALHPSPGSAKQKVDEARRAEYCSSPRKLSTCAFNSSGTFSPIVILCLPHQSCRSAGVRPRGRRRVVGERGKHRKMTEPQKRVFHNRCTCFPGPSLDHCPPQVTHCTGSLASVGCHGCRGHLAAACGLQARSRWGRDAQYATLEGLPAASSSNGSMQLPV